MSSCYEIRKKGFKKCCSPTFKGRENKKELNINLIFRELILQGYYSNLVYVQEIFSLLIYIGFSLKRMLSTDPYSCKKMLLF
jgi:hypothetical protein